jgi:hypothetical protein
VYIVFRVPTRERVLERSAAAHDTSDRV